MRLADALIHLLVTELPVRTATGKPNSVANAFAKYVFPVPRWAVKEDI
jgi:hypothetical protein